MVGVYTNPDLLARLDAIVAKYGEMLSRSGVAARCMELGLAQIEASPDKLFQPTKVRP